MERINERLYGLLLVLLEPFTFGLTDTRVYSGFWTFEKYWGTLGLVQKGYLFLNNYHIINLVAVFGIAAIAASMIVKVVIRKLIHGK